MIRPNESRFVMICVLRGNGSVNYEVEWYFMLS